MVTAHVLDGELAGVEEGVKKAAGVGSKNRKHWDRSPNLHPPDTKQANDDQLLEQLHL